MVIVGIYFVCLLAQIIIIIAHDQITQSVRSNNEAGATLVRFYFLGSCLLVSRFALRLAIAIRTQSSTNNTNATRETSGELRAL